MVPLQLRLKNFLSYGEDAPVLDLEDIHVACLSGGNGQGKSALLDAITWAVWGEARKSSEARKPDEELLRIGSSVDGGLVRVHRERRCRVPRSAELPAVGQRQDLEARPRVPPSATATTGRPLTTGIYS